MVKTMGKRSFRIECGVPQDMGVALVLVRSIVPLSPPWERGRVRGTCGRSSLTPTPALPRRGGGTETNLGALSIPSRAGLATLCEQRGET